MTDAPEPRREPASDDEGSPVRDVLEAFNAEEAVEPHPGEREDEDAEQVLNPDSPVEP